MRGKVRPLFDWYTSYMYNNNHTPKHETTLFDLRALRLGETANLWPYFQSGLSNYGSFAAIDVAADGAVRAAPFNENGCRCCVNLKGNFYCGQCVKPIELGLSP